MDPTHPLDRRLLEFAEAMKAKFYERADRHVGASVTDRDFDWGAQLDPVEILTHVLKEIDEWLDSSGEDEAKESVDVANMMFLGRALYLEREWQKAARDGGR